MKKLFLSFVLISLLVGIPSWNAFAETDAKQPANSTDAAGFSVARLVVGTGMDGKEPEGVADIFPSNTEKVICFLDARDIAADTEIAFVWIFNGKEILKTNLPLKAGYRWRTRADKRLYAKTGEWKVEAAWPWDLQVESSEPLEDVPHEARPIPPAPRGLRRSNSPWWATAR